MNSNLKLLPAALLVAMLALAGCGGGDDTPVAPTEPTEPTEPPGPTALETASDEQAKALAAEAAAEDLLEKAVAASEELGTKDVDGSSMMASENAMLVLMAETAIMAEYEKAKAAHTAAQAAHTAAPAEQKARIAVMVAAAMDAADAIKAILDAEDVADTEDGSLAEAVARVRTGAKTTDTDAMIAQAKAKAVATAIAAAIKNQIPDATASPAITLGPIAPLSSAPAGATMRAGLAGMTFAEITGGNVKHATSIKDFKSGADPATASAFALPAAGAAGTTIGTAVAATYMGIPGALDCLAGETCTYDSTGKITGVVNFTPSSQTNLWAQATYGGDYAQVTNTATYGHWLTAAGAVMLHADNSSSTGLNWERAATSTTVTTAEYTGKAGGYSEKTTGTGAAATSASGTFTADVTLNATFGAGATDALLGGSISNFTGGSHVDTYCHAELGMTERMPTIR